jgi:cytochrome c6
MKNYLLSLFFSSFLLLGFSNPINAADIETGKNIFEGNCAACHANGKNIIIIDKTLEKNVLETNGMYSDKAIVTQVTNGKNAMPAFGDRLTDDEIESVAKYVLDQSDKGW